MRNIILAAAISIIASAMLYGAATAIGVQADVAKGLAGLPAFAIKNIYEFLELKTAKKAISEIGSASISSLEDYLLSPFASFVIGLVMFVGMILVTGGLYGCLVGLAFAASHMVIDPDADAKLFSSLVVLLAFPLRVVASAEIGRWVGVRCRRYIWVTGIAAASMGTAVSFLIGLMLISEQTLKALADADGSKSDLALSQFISILPDIIIYMLSAAAGTWFGRRRRLTRYIGFLLAVLPQQTRSTIVELARDEAVKVRGSSLRLLHRF